MHSYLTYIQKDSYIHVRNHIYIYTYIHIKKLHTAYILKYPCIYNPYVIRIHSIHIYIIYIENHWYAWNTQQTPWCRLDLHTSLSKWASSSLEQLKHHIILIADEMAIQDTDRTVHEISELLPWHLFTTAPNIQEHYTQKNMTFICKAWRKGASNGLRQTCPRGSTYVLWNGTRRGHCIESNATHFINAS